MVINSLSTGTVFIRQNLTFDCPRTQRINQDIYDDFKLKKKNLWSLWFIQTYLSVVRVNNKIYYTVDLVIFACLDFREFVILRHFTKYRIRELSILMIGRIIIITILRDS